MQFSLQLPRLDKVQYFVMISLSVLPVFRSSSSVRSLRTGVGFFFTNVLLYLQIAELTLESFT